MIYVHIHNNTNQPYWSVIKNNPRLQNAGVDINGFEHVSFDEMLAMLLCLCRFCLGAIGNAFFQRIACFYPESVEIYKQKKEGIKR